MMRPSADFEGSHDGDRRGDSVGGDLVYAFGKHGVARDQYGDLSFQPVGMGVPASGLGWSGVPGPYKTGGTLAGAGGAFGEGGC